MEDGFVELRSTDNSIVYVRPSSVSAFEVVTSSNRVEGHIKIFIGGFKFLIQIEKEELLKKLNSTQR